MKRNNIIFILIFLIFSYNNVNCQTVWAWGGNCCGQLGIGKDCSYEVPVLVKNMSSVVSISAGEFHSIALKNNGTVWAWGANFHGQLGNWDWGIGSHENLPVKVVTEYDEELKDVIKISAGYTYTLALKSDGTVWGWGYDSACQLGQGEPWYEVPVAIKVQGIENVIDISAGGPVSLAVKADGTVWWWGWITTSPEGGQSTTIAKSCLPTQISNLENVKAVEANYTWTTGPLALKNDGTVWEFWFGRNANSKKIMEGVKQISTGFGHTLALKEDGTVWAWGSNYYGQLGNGTNKDSYTPVQVPNLNDIIAVEAGYSHSLALKRDGTVLAWGENISGELGNGTEIDSNVPVPVLNLENIVSISSYYDFNLALDKDGFVWAWGNNEYGQMGNGYDTYVEVPERLELNDILSLSCNWDHTLALDKYGEVWAWGCAEEGQLGIGELKDTEDIPFPIKVLGLENIISVKAGAEYSLALDKDGDVWVWGSNRFGELGLGTNIDYNYPVKNPYLKDIVEISAEWANSYALKRDGTVWAWGWNKYGQLGNGNNEDQNIPVMVSNLTDVIEISCASHCLALKRDGTVWAWGWNEYGQLGNGTNTSSNIPIQVQKLSNIISIFAGEYNSFAIDRDGKVYGWGYNKDGQLGDGTTSDSNLPIEINLLKEMGIVQIKSNFYSTLAMDKGGNVWEWGKTSQGDSLTPIKLERIKNAIFIERGRSSSSFAISQSEHRIPF